MEVLSKINTYRKSNKFCDVVVKVGTECFGAHKAVLAASSDYFEECIDDTCTSILVTKVNAITFSSILDFVYASNVDINSDNYEKLQEAAEIFNISKLTQLCKEYETSMENHVTVNIGQSCLDPVSNADKLDDTLLKLKDSTEIRRSQQVSIFPISRRRERKAKRAAYATMNKSLEYMDSEDEMEHQPNTLASFDNDEPCLDWNRDDHLQPKKQNSVSSESASFECQICKATFPQFLAYQLHLLCHDDKPTYKCDICGKIETTNGRMKDHMEEFHSANTATTDQITPALIPPHYCHLCERSFSTAHNLSVHMKTHDLQELSVAAKDTKDKPLSTCTICAKVFKNRSHLRRHMIIHTGERKHCCSTCGKRFLKTDHLKRHERTHTNERPFACEDCGKTFRDKDYLKRHQVSHSSERPYFCEICGKQFKEKSTLSSHQKSHSATAKSCDICGKSFKSSERLRNHTLKHAEEKPHVCDTCGRKFAYVGRLRKHLLSHTGERPYHCETCGKQFRDNHSLRLHQKIHTGIGLFPCQHCEKQFTNQYHLTRHERMHTGEKPFRCDNCNRSFSRVDNLDAHKKACVGNTNFSKRRSRNGLVSESLTKKREKTDQGSNERDDSESNGIVPLDHVMASHDGDPPSLVDQPHYQARNVSEALKFVDEPLQAATSSPLELDHGNPKYFPGMLPQSFPIMTTNGSSNPQLLLPPQPSHSLDGRMNEFHHPGIDQGQPSPQNSQIVNFDVNSAGNTFIGYGQSAL